MSEPARPDTWMPFRIGIYLGDTMHLTTEQHGAYVLLILAYWRRGGPLPDDDQQLQQIVKADAKAWKRLRPILAPFFRVDDGVWWHKRIEKELTEAADNIAKNKKRTAAATEARKRNDGSNDERNEQRNDARDETRNDERTGTVTRSSLPLPKPEERKKERKGRAREPHERWEEFRQSYPDRGGGPMGWNEASGRFSALIEAKHATADELIGAAKAYRAAMAGKQDRSVVQQASTFLGPQKATWREYVGKPAELALAHPNLPSWHDANAKASG